jgi:hypothetical protein
MLDALSPSHCPLTGNWNSQLTLLRVVLPRFQYWKRYITVDKPDYGDVAPLPDYPDKPDVPESALAYQPSN